MKKLMILGASTYQVPLIKTAKRMGLYTIVVSIPGKYKGFEYADKVYEIDTRDRNQVLEAAKKEKIDGICTSGTDVAVGTIAYVCKEMGLAGIPLEAAETLTDKALMKKAFLDGGVSASQGDKAFSVDDAKVVAKQIGYPVVVKRVDSSGSRGITVIKEESEMEEAFNYALKGSQKDYVLVEGLLTGTEIGVDGFVMNGELVFLAPHSKFVYSGNHTNVPIGHSFPINCTKAQCDEIHRQMQLAVSATKTDKCSVNADVFIDKDKVSIIEMGGRTGATCIPELISMSYGFDFYEKMILNALGEKVDITIISNNPCMAKLLLSPINGLVTNIDLDKIEKIRKTGAIVELDCEVGDRVFEVNDGTDRIGHVIMATDSEEKLDKVIRDVYECIWINNCNLRGLF